MWNTVRGVVRAFAGDERFSGARVEELAANPAGAAVHAEAKDSFFVVWSRRCCCCCCLHERFLSLSLESLYRAWCLLLNGAKETGTHLTDTRERESERGESEALQDYYYAKYL